MQIDPDDVDPIRKRACKEVSNELEEQIYNDVESVVLKEAYGSSYKAHIPHPTMENEPICNQISRVTESSGDVDFVEKPKEMYPLSFCNYCRVCAEVYRTYKQ